MSLGRPDWCGEVEEANFSDATDATDAADADTLSAKTCKTDKLKIELLMKGEQEAKLQEPQPEAALDEHLMSLFLLMFNLL